MSLTSSLFCFFGFGLSFKPWKLLRHLPLIFQSLFIPHTFMHTWLRAVHSDPGIWVTDGSPLQYSCLEDPRDGEAWWAAVYGVAQSQTRLNRLSSSSSSLWRTLPQSLPLAGCLLDWMDSYWNDESLSSNSVFKVSGEQIDSTKDWRLCWRGSC